MSFCVAEVLVRNRRDVLPGGSSGAYAFNVRQNETPTHQSHELRNGCVLAMLPGLRKGPARPAPRMFIGCSERQMLPRAMGGFFVARTSHWGSLVALQPGRTSDTSHPVPNISHDVLEAPRLKVILLRSLTHQSCITYRSIDLRTVEDSMRRVILDLLMGSLRLRVHWY